MYYTTGGKKLQFRVTAAQLHGAAQGKLIKKFECMCYICLFTTFFLNECMLNFEEKSKRNLTVIQ